MYSQTSIKRLSRQSASSQVDGGDSNSSYLSIKRVDTNSQASSAFAVTKRAQDRLIHEVEEELHDLRSDDEREEQVSLQDALQYMNSMRSKDSKNMSRLSSSQQLEIASDEGKEPKKPQSKQKPK